MPKNILVCLDGTWDTAHRELQDDSNVARLYSGAVKDEGQVTHYVAGVGTDWYDRFRGGAFGYGLSEKIQEGYNFIVDQYEDGDEIFLFGFSRGAFSARSLGGLIGTAGILRRERRSLADMAYEVYRAAPDHPDTAATFKATYSCGDDTIAMIGVWDTVGALGIPGFLDVLDPYPHSFHNTNLGRHVSAAYQALAIDEQRNDFVPTLWTGQAAPNQTIEQMWFAGVHSDVGGGYSDDSGLADITLAWMAACALQHGVRFYPDVVPEPAPQFCYGKLHNSLTPVFALREHGPRVIQAGAPIHTSVQDRLRGMQPCQPGPYRPANIPAPPTYVP